MSSLATELLADLPVETEAACPACGTRGLVIFHEQASIPAHSCRLLSSRTEAIEFPTGAMRLGLCPHCGFITNAAYDASLQSYFVDYEETQGFSPRFRTFMRDLAQHWIDRYELRGRTALEIGCGKGEFLLSMLELGVSRGIGIDPAIVLERVDSPAANRVEFIRDLYSERYTHLTADAVVCRHTLEHIQPVAAFLSLIRESVANKPGSVVLFDLPDAMRVLRECAFWDVYYEHCSYFTPGSLSRLFRMSGFEVIGLELDYDDQYIVLEARLSETTDGRLPLEDSVEEIAEAAVRYRTDLEATQERWTREIAEVRGRGGRVVVWGSGSKGVAFLTTLGIRDEITYVVDVNPYKQGKFMAATGQEIVAPEFLRDYRPDLVVVMNPIYIGEIGGELARLGVDAHVQAV